MFASALTGIMRSMLSAHDLPAANPPGLSAETAALVAQLLQRLQDQEQQLAEHSSALAQRDQALAERDALLQRKDREIALREAKIEKITFELARLKRWKFGAKSEVMNADQRRLFATTTIWSARSSRGPWDAGHGCSWAANWPASAPPS